MEYGALTRLTGEDLLAGLRAAYQAEIQAVADYYRHAQAVAQAEIGETLATLAEVEREHARQLSQRITALGGKPSQDRPVAASAGGSLAEWLAHDLRGEQWAIVEYARLVAGIMDDDATAELMAELLRDEIRHARWLKATLRAVEKGDEIR
jgi:bacterioferritin (cytochrome b1)